MVPPYEELDPRRRGHENDAHRVRSSDAHIHTHIRMEKQVHRRAGEGK